MSFRSKCVAALMACWVFMGVVAPAPAAIITWGPATTVSGDTDVSTTGTLDRAYNFGASGAGSTTVNGVTFAAFESPTNVTPVTVGATSVSATGGQGIVNAYNGYSSGAAPFNNLSASYKTLLQTGVYNDAGSLAVTLSGLTIGQQYQVQTFVNDSRSCCSNRTEDVTSGGNTVTLKYNVAGVDGGVGQFTLGTFTADATSQTITYTNSASAQIQALQLRAISVPEPTALCLAGLGAWGLLRRTRGAVPATTRKA